MMYTLNQSVTETIRREEGSAVVEISRQVSVGADVVNTTTKRICHFVSFKPITKALETTNGQEDRYLATFQLTYEAGGFLASRHLNQRNTSVVPNLGKLMENCPDLEFSYEMLDTQLNRFVSLRHLLEVVQRPTTPGTFPTSPSQKRLPYPTAIIGGAASYISLALSSLTGVYEIPQISGTSSATILDDKTKTPYFSRIVPTSRAISEALLVYLESLGVTHFGCIYARDLYGTSFGEGVIAAAHSHNVTLYSIAYEVGDVPSLQTALEYLASTDVRYFMGIFHIESYKAAFQIAYDLGIMGHSGYAWWVGDNNVELTTAKFSLNASTESDIAKAMNGLGVIMGGFSQHPVLTQTMEEDFPNDEQLWNDFVEAHQESVQPYLEQFNFTETPLRPSIYVGVVYDAVIAAGLAACRQADPFFQSSQLLHSIRHDTAFEGASGFVTLNNKTGTRDLLGLRYSISNIVIADADQQDLEGRIRFNATKRVVIEFPNSVIDQGAGPYIYADNTPVAPPILPPVAMDLNLIPSPVRIFGLVLMGLVMLVALCGIVFAYNYRKLRAIKAAQPEFLVLIAGGCIVMASAILPMSYQEPMSQERLDAACMSNLYLFSVGLVTSFSALACKLYRVNKLLRKASRFRRIQVRVQDVLLPLIVLLAINLIILVTWHLVDPLRWTRHTLPGSVDNFGRPTSTYATCSGTNATMERVFYALFFTVNLAALLLANWESYRGRYLPSQFNETEGIATAMFLLLESLLLGLPILFVVQQDPTSAFVVKSILIFCAAASILYPMFSPVWNPNQQGGAASERRTICTSRPFSSNETTIGGMMGDSYRGHLPGGSTRTSFWNSTHNMNPVKRNSMRSRI